MQTISIPVSEYQKLTSELALLKDAKLLEKLNQLIDLLYQDKYGLYMQDFTDDLTAYSIENNWNNTNNAWDAI